MNDVTCDSCGCVSALGLNGLECCEFATWKAPCDRCGTPTRWMFRGAGRKRTRGNVCTCTVDPRQVAEQQAKRAESDRLEREKAERGARYRALDIAREHQESEIASAVACLDRKNGQCQVRPSQLPFSFCGKCEHITKGRQPKLIGRRPPDCIPPLGHVRMVEVDA